MSGVVLAGYFFRGPVVLPEVDLESMEPQVAARIEARGEAVREDPGSSEAWGELGLVYQAHGLHAAAAEAYGHAVALAPHEFRWRYLAVHALRGVDVRRAIEAAQQAAKERDDYAPLFVVEGEMLEEVDEPERALALYRRAAELDSGNAVAAFGLGRLLLAKEDTDEALEWLRRAEELAPEAGAIHAMLARAYRRLDDREKAEEEARLAFEKKDPIPIEDPIHFEMREQSVASTALLRRAMAADRTGDHAEAERIYRSLVELRPDDPDMRARFGDALAQQDERTEARREYEAALAIQPEHASAHYGLANMLNLERDYEGAERHYREALRLRADHVPTYVNLGSLLVFRGQLEEAETLFRKGLEIDPESVGCHRQLGTLLLKTHRPEEAIGHLEKAVAALPEEGNLHASLAFALFQTGRMSEAREEAQQAEARGVTLPEAFKKALN